MLWCNMFVLRPGVESPAMEEPLLLFVLESFLSLDSVLCASFLGGSSAGSECGNSEGSSSSNSGSEGPCWWPGGRQRVQQQGR
jgi:hypothetical protein